MPAKFRNLACLLALLAAAGCAGQSSNSASTPASTPAEAQGAGSLDPGDVVNRSQEQGCQLIPYTSRRETCVRENDGLHQPTACNAPACAAGAGHQANRERREAWASCVARRTAIEAAFSGTKRDLKEFQRGPQWKGWRADWKAAEKLIITKIEEGEQGHKDALRAAKDNLAKCERIAPPAGG